MSRHALHLPSRLGLAVAAWLMITGPVTADSTDSIVISSDEKISPTLDAVMILDYGASPFKRPGQHQPVNRATMLDQKEAMIRYQQMIQRSRYYRYLDFSIEELENHAGNDSEAAMLLGVRLYQTGRFGESIEAFGRARELNPEQARSAELYLGMLVIGDETARAVEAGQRLRDAFPENVVIRFNLACAMARENMIDDALEQLEFLARLPWDDLMYHMEDRDLDTLRDVPRFISLLESLDTAGRTRILEVLSVREL
jgi:tetratricopeptide (TPR) repeat protein